MTADLGSPVAADLAGEGARFIAHPIAVSRAYEQLAAEIRARIVAGELREGDRLPSELAIAREARVSRGTVREALRVLEEGGFVGRASPRILVVRTPQEDEPAVRETTRALRQSNVTFDDIHEALLALDPALTRLATERAQIEDIERLEQHLVGQERVLSQPQTWSGLDDEFHVLIAQMSGNAPLILARRPISAVLLPVVQRFVREERMTRAAFVFHERIVEQMRGGDPEAAEFMTRKHINDFRKAWEHAGLDVHLSVGQLD